MLFILCLLVAHAADPSDAYAEQQLVRHVFDSRKLATQYTGSVLGDTVVYTPEMVEIGSYSWSVLHGERPMTAWSFAELTDDQGKLEELHAEVRKNRRLSWVAAGLGAPLAAGGAAMYLQDKDAFKESKLGPALVGAGGLGLILAAVGFSGAKDIGSTVDGAYSAGQVDKQIRKYNAALAERLGLDPAAAATAHPDVLLHRS